VSDIDGRACDHRLIERRAMVQIAYRFADVSGHRLFYREAGEQNDRTVLLMHGAPASSFMFRGLIPLLADRWHVVAPDLLGFGLSDSPTVDDFDYTFETLTDVTEQLLKQLRINKFAMYVQDYGAPVGWRLALRHPERVSAIITQNGNAYNEGFVPSFWNPLWTYVDTPDFTTEAPIRKALTIERIKWQYLHGVADPSTVDPDTWTHDFHALQRPGNLDVQLRLLRDYPSNIDLYPAVHEYFRRSQVPLTAIWGRHDEIFAPAGAHGFACDLPDAEIHLLDGGHFLLESHLDAVAGYVRGFLARTFSTQ
jgi:pimeloyl-ACP methyl ester carboxylesterase